MPTITIRPTNGPLSVTAIDCGTSIPKLGGSVNISPFSNLTSFKCNSNDIVSVTGYEDKSAITFLEFFNNKITGSLPNLSGMTALKEFRCYTNLLSGSIPTANISGLAAIEIMNYGENNISGSIPNINSLTTLKNFRCNTNKHTGGIPSLTGLSNLQFFYCYRNELTENIPSLAGLIALQEFRCYENLYVTNEYSAPGRGIGGNIPSLTGLSALKVFQCYRNALTGPIPPSLTGLSGLQEFTCYDNMLSGSIPSLAGCNALTNFQCHDNDLTGPIPPSLSNLPAIQTFNCGGNELTENIPAPLPSTITTFVCSKNKLSTTIPTLTGLNNLVEFACDNNRAIPAESITGVNGSIPNLGLSPALQLFRCNDTEVNGFVGTTVPTILGNFQAFNTNLTASAIDNILKAFVDAERLTSGSNFSRNAETLVTVSLPGHGFLSGQRLSITAAEGSTFQSALTGTYTIAVTGLNSFTYTTPTSGTLTGTGNAWLSAGTKIINLGGSRPTGGTVLTPTYTGTTQSTAGSNFSRAAGSTTVTVNLTSHGYITNQLVTVTSATKTTSGSNFSRPVGSTTVTVNLTSHGFTNGQSVIISGDTASSFPVDLTGTYTITVTGLNSFTYTTATSGALIGTGLGIISDNTLQSAFKGTFKITRVNDNSFTYTTVTTDALSGSGTAALRSSTVLTEGYARYQALTQVNRPQGIWTVVINQP
jgi:hypothetical protein